MCVCGFGSLSCSYGSLIFCSFLLLASTYNSGSDNETPVHPELYGESVIIQILSLDWKYVCGGAPAARGGVHMETHGILTLFQECLITWRDPL